MTTKAHKYNIYYSMSSQLHRQKRQYLLVLLLFNWPSFLELLEIKLGLRQTNLWMCENQQQQSTERNLQITTTIKCIKSLSQL